MVEGEEGEVTGEITDPGKMPPSGTTGTPAHREAAGRGVGWRLFKAPSFKHSMGVWQALVTCFG